MYELDAVDIYKLVLEGKRIKIFPKGFWKRPEALNNARDCMIYLLEEVLQLDENDIVENISKSIFLKNKLGGMLTLCFNGSVFEALDCAYPKKISSLGIKERTNGLLG